MTQFPREDRLWEEPLCGEVSPAGVEMDEVLLKKLPEAVKLHRVCQHAPFLVGWEACEVHSLKSLGKQSRKERLRLILLGDFIFFQHAVVGLEERFALGQASLHQPDVVSVEAHVAQLFGSGVQVKFALLGVFWVLQEFAPLSGEGAFCFDEVREVWGHHGHNILDAQLLDHFANEKTVLFLSLCPDQKHLSVHRERLSLVFGSVVDLLDDESVWYVHVANLSPAFRWRPGPDLFFLGKTVSQVHPNCVGLFF